jgi:hypothetical protein
MHIREWAEQRRKFYMDGTERDDLGAILERLLSTQKGARALKGAERRWEKRDRKQHSYPWGHDADYLHQAYGKKRGKR